MTDKTRIILVGPEQKRFARQCLDHAPFGYVCTIEEMNRTLEQNAAQWPILDAFSEQRQWSVNGSLVYMTNEEWKDILTAAFKDETIRLAAGLKGGVVMLGKRTSKFKKKEFGDWLEFLNATAIELDVKVPEPKREGDDEMMQRYA
jgi:NinB protein